ncbi:hypothetical protein [Streptomyces sp. NPDC001604]|uniref:hypothetical protein n=1 Tax=Streptomyces sp. NPDC001604 TaxID=3364593 RepID=UPI0036A8FD70
MDADIARDELFRPHWLEGPLEEILDKAAMGEPIVTVAASATDRIESAVVASEGTSRRNAPAGRRKR